VQLIAVDGFSAEGPAPGQMITFVLAQELTVRGQTLARAGEVASGRISQVSAPKTPGELMSVALERTTLHVGSVNVPLRSSQVRGGVNPMQYKESPDSTRAEVTLFVAENVQFPESQ